MATLITLVDGTVPVAADFNTSLVNLNTELRPVATGGTGAATLTSNGVLYGNGTSAVGITAAGSAYNALRVPAAGGAPAFGALDISQSAAVTGNLPLANGGLGTNLTDPNADRIVFWDDSAGVMAFLTAGTGLTISGTTITSAAGFIGVRAYNSGALSTSNDTNTILTLDSERYDTTAFHSTASNTSRLTVPTGQAGYYHITASVEWANAAGGSRGIEILLNGATVIAGQSGLPTTSDSIVTKQAVSTDYNLAVADYVEIRVRQTQGTLNVNATGNYSPEFMMFLIGT